MDKTTLSFFAAELLALMGMMAPVWVNNIKKEVREVGWQQRQYMTLVQ